MNYIENKWLQQIHHCDVRAFLAVSHSQWRRHALRAARAISHTADGWPYLLVPALLYPLNRESAVTVACLLTLGFVIERTIYLALKKGFKRRRPPQAIPGYCSVINASDEFSFPSGHTSGAFLVCTTLLITLGIAALPLYAWALLVGCSRVILGVHFPTDIAAGAVIGSATALLSAGVF